MKFSIFLYSLIALASSVYAEQMLDFPDPKTVQAYEEYWSRLEQENRAQTTEIIRANSAGNKNIEEDAKQSLAKLDGRQTIRMQEAISKYREHLRESPRAENRPFVLLNLAQMLHQVAKSSPDVVKKNQVNTEALDYLKELEMSHNDFTNRADGLYLQAIVARELEDEDLLQSTLQKLMVSGDSKPNLYAAMAALDLGDMAYGKQDVTRAMAMYKRSESILEHLPEGNPSSDKKELEQTRLHYRLAWTKYKTTDLEGAIFYAKKILRPGATVKAATSRDRFRIDASEIIADSLYELNQAAKITAFFKDRDLNAHVDSVGLRMMKRYYEAEIYQQVDKVAQLVLAVSPISLDYPSILMLGSLAAKKLNNVQKRVEYLEQLVLLAPKKSLWREKFKSEHNAQLDLEKIALDAGQFVAHYYYDNALATGDQRQYLSARTFYDILIEFNPNGAEANTWRLRRAHALYFMDELAEAQTGYKELIEHFRIETAQLEVALYQMVLTNEKLWRKSFAENLEKGLNPTTETPVIEKLSQLEKAVDQFAARFPNQTRSVDLLLVAASSNRDQERFENALSYLRRALLSFPNSIQRSQALRGIVFNFIKSKTSAELVSEVVQLLSLEDFKTLDPSLEKELYSVLSTAVIAEAEKLNNTAQVYKSAQLQISIASHFKKIPKWNEIYRDGAYSLAIAGEWLEAEKTALNYLQEKNTTFAGDFIYLLARAQEFQLRVGESAKTYMRLSRDYPSHTRSNSALERAESLAYTDGMLTLAAVAAQTIADRSKTTELKITALDRCIQYHVEQSTFKEALPCAQKRARASKDLKQNFKSQIILAKILYLEGNEQKAVDDFELLEKRLREKKSSLGISYNELSAEVNLQLGLDAKKRFLDFQIRERSGSILAKVQEKSKLFEELTMRFTRVADTKKPEFAPQARFELASAATIFAGDITALPVQEEAALTLKSHARFQKNISQLQDLAKRLNTANLSEKRQNPDVYRNNQWMEKSAQAIGVASFSKEDEKQLAVDKVKPALQIPYPAAWSNQ